MNGGTHQVRDQINIRHITQLHFSNGFDTNFKYKPDK